METHAASWLCEALGLPMLVEAADGSLQYNSAATDASSAHDRPSLGTCLRRLGAGGLSEQTLSEAAHLARSGQPQRVACPSGVTLLMLPEGEGRMSVVVVPRGLLDRVALERRAAATDMTAGVSHELANALGAIAGWARLAKQGERLDEALDLIERSAENAWTAARKVLGDLGGDKKNGDEVVDLSAFVDEAATLLAPKAAAKSVRVETRITPHLSVRSDRGAAWTIVWNLAANAVEALPRGGRVELRLLRSAEGHVVLEVEDNGPGMTGEQKQKAFEPYFTTKRGGTGLGLAMVKQAVDELDGTIGLESQPGQGTRFTVSIPRARSVRRSQSVKRSSGVFYAETIDQRVLVVDDDVGLREMIATALSMRGAEVVCVANAEAALRQTGPFALAVIDLLLPGLRGDELLAQLRDRGIAQLGLLISGTEVPSEPAEGGAPDAVLRKPFELEDLFEQLAALLGNGERASAAS